MEVFCVVWERVYRDDATSEVLHVFSSYAKAKDFLRLVLNEDYKSHPAVDEDLDGFIEDHYTSEWKDEWAFDDDSYLDRYGVYAVDLD